MLPILHEPVPDTFIHLDGLYPQGGSEGDQMELVDIGGGVLRWRPTTPTALSASPGMRPKWNGTAIVWGYEYYTIPYVIDGGGSEITLGYKGIVPIDTPGTIVAARLMAADATVSGDIEIDIWKNTFPTRPTVSDSIVASAPLVITADTDYEDIVLTGWDPALAAGNVLAFNVDVIANFQRMLVWLTVRKS